MVTFQKKKMMIITSTEQRCRHCLGTAWHRSNVSNRYIKCRACNGTGAQLKIQVSAPKPEEAEIKQRIYAQPLNIVSKPWWQKIFYVPTVWWTHYKLTRKTLPRLWSFQFAITWTMLILFPSIAAFFISSKNEEE
jgi:hypothetical protein